MGNYIDLLNMVKAAILEYACIFKTVPNLVSVYEDTLYNCNRTLEIPI